jgi:hypothetical protein
MLVVSNGLRADQQRLDREGLAQLRVAEVVAHHLPDAAVGAQLGQTRDLLRHRRQLMERRVSQLGEPDIVDPPAMFDHAQIAVAVFRLEPGDLAQCILDGAAVIEMRAVLIVEPVPGAERPELHIVFAFLAEQREQFVEQERGGDDSRPGIVAETVALEYLRPSAQLLAALQQRHGVALRPQPQRRRDAAKARSDNDGERSCCRLN